MSPTPLNMSDAHGSTRQASSGLYALWLTAAPPAVQGAAQSREPELWPRRRAARAQARRARVASGAALLRSVSLARSRYHSIEYFSGGGSLSCLGGERLGTAGRSLGTWGCMQVAGCRVAGALRCMARGAPSAPVVIGGQVHVDTHEVLLA